MINVSQRKLSLKTMDEVLLTVEIFERVEVIDETMLVHVKEALVLAAVCHSGQTRANRGNLPRDTYMTHPLRNTLRLLRYGVTDEDIIIASLLHDTVEDAADRILALTGWALLMRHDSQFDKDAYNRYQALRYISFEFNDDVAFLVKQVSNPIKEVIPGVGAPRSETRADYQAHVIDVISDPRVALVKFSDFVDNAVGLYHNTGMPARAIEHLTLKYYPLLSVFSERLCRDDIAQYMPSQGLTRALGHLQTGKTELTKMMDGQ